MKSKQHGVFSNFLFIIRYTYNINKLFLGLKIAQITLNILSQFVPIIFIRLILNEISLNRNFKMTLVYISIFSLLTFLANVILTTLDYFSKNQLEITIRKMKNELGNVVMKMDYCSVEQPQIRDFVELASDSINFSTVYTQIEIIITTFFAAIGLISIIVTVQPIILLFVAFSSIIRLLVDKKNRKLWGKWRPKYAPLLRKLNYFFRIMKTVEFGKEIRINNLQKWIYQKTDEHTEEYLKKATKHNFEIQRNGIVASLANIIQESFVYLVLVYNVVFNGLTIGDFSMYITSINKFIDNVSSLINAVSTIMQVSLFVGDFRYCLDLSNQKNESKTILPNKELILIEFKNVSFKYPNSDKYVLKNISLKFKSNETYSIVGINGAGKTTLVKLLCRFYEPTEGEILINGINIKYIDNYTNILSAVFQDYKLFSFSVEDNISLSDDSNKSEIYNYIKKCGLEKKINQLPQKLKTFVNKEFSSEGIEFSGGESQKLVLARALYKNAPIVILDEPTSALDPISEAELYSKFNEISGGKLAIYISHRLSSCQFCDQIIVLDQGEVVQCGSHSELVNERGLYAQLWGIQSQYYMG